MVCKESHSLVEGGKGKSKRNFGKSRKNKTSIKRRKRK
jgi:hypothetical protein